MTALLSAERELSEARMALEIAKIERDQLRMRVEELHRYLTKADARAERAEERLHEITMAISKLGQLALTRQALSTATEVLIDGKSILRLNNPVGDIDRQRR